MYKFVDIIIIIIIIETSMAECDKKRGDMVQKIAKIN